MCRFGEEGGRGSMEGGKRKYWAQGGRDAKQLCVRATGSTCEGQGVTVCQ